MFILQGLPKVGPRMAKKLLRHFGPVSNVVNATTQDLMRVEGVGEVSAEKTRLVLDTTYEAM